MRFSNPNVLVLQLDKNDPDFAVVENYEKKNLVLGLFPCSEQGFDCLIFVRFGLVLCFPVGF